MLEKGTPVLVTTAHRGVFFGYYESNEETTWRLTRARNCVYWPSENRGFLGLASVGPLEGARVGPAVDAIELYAVTAVVLVTAEAVGRWESAPWS